MLPSQHYQRDVDTGKVEFDHAQQAVLIECDRLRQALIQRHQQKNHRITRILSRFLRRDPLTGLYLYGEVGRGKTYIMDLFYESLPFTQKKRVHFYAFLQFLYRELKQRQGQTDPLIQIAKSLAKQYIVLCFDEVIVTDIGDAMLLGNVFNALFNAGLTLVATSNLPPDRLYENGLQRALFLPAIDAIKRHTQVIHLTSAMDYRLRTLTQAGIYFTPLNAATEHTMESLFYALTDGSSIVEQTPLFILNRSIDVKAKAQHVAWFDIYALCDIPRAPADYLELVKQFTTVFVSDVPVFSTKEDDLARNFISLVDVFYDHRAKLVISAEAEAIDLYPKTGRLAFAFDRTVSRLIEMQSTDYLKPI